MIMAGALSVTPVRPYVRTDLPKALKRDSIYNIDMLF